MTMTNCYMCERGELKAKKVPYAVYDVPVGKFDAEVCSKCGETFFTEETSKEITRATKQKGLWGLGATTKVGEAGSTLDIRLPKKIIAFLNLKKGEEVAIYPESKKRLIIEL